MTITTKETIIFFLRGAGSYHPTDNRKV